MVELLLRHQVLARHVAQVIAHGLHILGMAKQIIGGVVHESGHRHQTQIVTRWQVIPVQLHILIGTVAIRSKATALDDLDEVLHLLGSHSCRVVTQDHREHFL